MIHAVPLRCWIKQFDRLVGVLRSISVDKRPELTLTYVFQLYCDVIISVGARLLVVETNCMPWSERIA